MEPDRRSLRSRLSRAFSRAFGALIRADRRKAFVRELFYRAARRFTPAVAVESQGLRYFVSTDDHGVGMTLFMGDDIEGRTMENALRLLDGAGAPVPEGRTLIDVGAHIGTASVTALGAFGFGRAICFEPSPRNRELLTANLAGNGLADRATVVPVALSNQAGTATFEVAPMNPSDGRVRVDGAASDPGAFGEEGWETIEVPTVTLDSLVERGEVDLGEVGMVWIDAQGHEGQVLGGARSILGREIPVLIEFWPYGLRRAGGLDDLIGLVRDSFRLFVDLEGDGGGRGSPQPIDQLPALVEEYWGVAHTDLLLIP